MWFTNSYYHLRSTVKRERFFAQVYFSNETVSQTTVSTGPMKMFRLDHETMNVCQRNVARFAHVYTLVPEVFLSFHRISRSCERAAKRWDQGITCGAGLTKLTKFFRVLKLGVIAISERWRR